MVLIDFDKGIDLRDDKDKKIKKMGWDEYGKKLSEHDDDPHRRKE